MHPIAAKIGPFTIYSYGVMVAIAFLFGFFIASREAVRKGVKAELVYDMGFYLLAGSIIGARVYYIIFFGLKDFLADPVSALKLWQGGLAIHGGIIGGIISGVIFARARRVSFWLLADLAAPSVILGQAIGRIGCFLNGCCFGTPTDLPWGVVFPEGSIPWYTFGTQHLHPSQLYSSLYGLILFLILHWRLKRKAFDGQVVGLLFMIEAVFRYAIEYIRYYEDAMHIDLWGMHPTYNHLISIALFLLGLGIYLWGAKKSGLLATSPRNSQ